MGRHRRSDGPDHAPGDSRSAETGTGPGPGPGGDAGRPDAEPMGIAPYLNPEAYADAYTKARAYLFATDDDYARATGTTVPFPPEGYTPPEEPRPGRRRRRRRRIATPVRTGLLGVTAALALGTVALASGVVPGVQGYRLGGGNGTGTDHVRAAGSPTNSASEQGGTSGGVLPGGPAGGLGLPTSGTTGRAASPAHSAPGTAAAAPSTVPAATASPAPSPSASNSAPAPASPSAAPSTSPPAPASSSVSSPASPSPARPTAAPALTSAAKPSRTPARTASPTPSVTVPPVTVSAQALAEAQVLVLVNQERARVGCSALAANSALTSLAENFSEDMATGGFFSSTDPGGATPWDRAAKLGITGLGGENIARGQADPAAVVAAWMNSPGHRANILNCGFRTVGVGVHYGPGGPWWAQDFGY
ncbi:CAP domain-containing protein [Streptomyces sp. NPDC047017]|uniref:CAP domain-containing protein n=1 Tax=Streptomyces sp. NPDC047017 TaxID=3155024 RepID=UPI0033ECF598